MDSTFLNYPELRCAVKLRQQQSLTMKFSRFTKFALIISFDPQPHAKRYYPYVNLTRK